MRCLHGGVVQGAKGGHVTQVEGHGGVVRGSELAMHEVLNDEDVQNREV